MNFREEPEIKSVQTLLDNILSERQKIGAYIEAHTTLLSRVRQTPQETLAAVTSSLPLILLECPP